MSDSITLLAISGPLKGEKYRFEEPMTCLVGREKDCNLKIPEDIDGLISRHHCLFEVTPPVISIKDLDSSNGTFVNSQKLSVSSDFTQLFDGDRVKIGESVFKVQIKVQNPIEASTVPRCSQCGKSMEKETVGRKGEIVCSKCRDKTATLVANMTHDKKIDLPISGYEIIRELGSGGLGTVYLAERENNREQVALKVMLPDIAVDEECKDRFLREGENTKALKHANVVNVMDSGYSQGIFFFTLEYCNGGTVEDLMKKCEGKVPFEKACDITLQTLEGLSYAHSAEIPNIRLNDGTFGVGKGLVHRDIKPENILLCIDNEGNTTVKVADFGLAKAFNLAGLCGFTRTGAISGTMAFVCKQQVINYKYAKPEVDIWSTAAILYYMLTGETPRDCKNEKNPLKAILLSDPVPIRDRNKAIPKKVAEVIDRALADRTGLFYKSADDLTVDLTLAIT